MKDVVPRFWTMRGFRVRRRWGWDCHGLPIENIVEKEMGSQKKKDIEALGVEKFNELCRSKVLSYVEEWKKVIKRLGRWADMENSYKTMDIEFMESVWWVFKELWKRGLIYEGYRSMHICPRCETTLSQSEVTEGYKTIKDISATVKFELDTGDPDTQVLVNKIISPFAHLNPQKKIYLLAWTTTPWTLIGNVALAVNNDIKYIAVNYEGENYILAKDRVEEVMKGKEFKLGKEILGQELAGKKYKPLFDYYYQDKQLANRENGWQIYPADFVTTEEGTGIVHIAPAFGEEDMELGKKYNLPFVQHVGMDGVIKEEARDFAGLNVKPAEDHTQTDVEIIKYLARRGLLFAKEKYEHNYPHCWRCDTPLLNYATSSYFVAVTKIKEELLRKAQDINWFPPHIKKGRFGNWLAGARDWSISRQRFWASVIPVWVCGQCGEKKVIGSVKELEELSGEKVTDLHKHIIDRITFLCPHCQGEMRRVLDVLDTWFDSGSMPYAQVHYPFENKEIFEKNFPAQFIAEGADQTRAWFYYLYVLAVALFNKPAFRNVIVNGIVLAEDGKKMSKRLQNYPDPSFVMEKYGADALRYYLLTAPVMQAEDLCFSEKGVDEVLKKVILILRNVVNFYKMYESQWDKRELSSKGAPQESKHVLDQWIKARLNELIKEVKTNMEGYNLIKSTRPIGEFINDLSTWYLRRSRERFKEEGSSAQQEALQTTYQVLLELSKVMAPFMPFLAEHVYKEIGGEKESVHLEDWPEEGEIKEEALNKMKQTRKIVEMALAERAKAGIKVRQPLARLTIHGKETDLEEEYINLIKEEVNIKEATIEKGEELAVELDTDITPELKQEGILRELIRLVNGLRKQSGFTIEDRINIYWDSSSSLVSSTLDRFKEGLIKETLAVSVLKSRKDLPENQQKKINIEGEELWIGIEKV